MTLAAVIDPSSFIWDNQHFDANTSQYYNIMEVFPTILEKLKVKKIPIVMRYELLKEILSNFPHESIPKQYRTF